MISNLYVFEHEDIYESVLNFYSLPNNDVGIKWEAKCDVFWNEQYGSELDLYIETPLEFNGVWFGRLKEKDDKTKLAKAFDPKDFYFTQTEYGVTLFKPKMT